MVERLQDNQRLPEMSVRNRRSSYNCFFSIDTLSFCGPFACVVRGTILTVSIGIVGNARTVAVGLRTVAGGDETDSRFSADGILGEKPAGCRRGRLRHRPCDTFGMNWILLRSHSCLCLSPCPFPSSSSCLFLSSSSSYHIDTFDLPVVDFH